MGSCLHERSDFQADTGIKGKAIFPYWPHIGIRFFIHEIFRLSQARFLPKTIIYSDLKYQGADHVYDPSVRADSSELSRDDANGSLRSIGGNAIIA